MKNIYRVLLLLFILVVGGVEAFAQNYVWWGYGQSDEKLERRLEITTVEGSKSSGNGLGVWNSNDYHYDNVNIGKDNKSVTFNGAYELNDKYTVTNGQVTSEDDEIKFSTGYALANITIGVALKKGTSYTSSKKLKLDDVSVYLGITENDYAGNNDGLEGTGTNYKEVKIWNVSSGQHSLKRDDCTIGVFYIKVEEVDQNAPLTSLPGYGYTPGLWETFRHPDGLRLYLGGWKYQKSSKLAGRYKENTLTENYYKNADNPKMTDSWDAAKINYSPGAEDPYFYDYTDVSNFKSRRTIPFRPVKKPVEIVNLTTGMFHVWDGSGANAQINEKAYPFCINNIGKTVYDTDNIYGNSNLEPLQYADLTGYKVLKLTVTEATPRLVFNLQTGDPATGLDIKGEKEETKKYVSKNDDVWTIDLALITEDLGYAHLNAIKEANWQKNSTFVSAQLINTSEEPTDGYIEMGEYNEYSYAKDNARNEYIENDYTGGYEFISKTPGAGKAKGNPFTVPCFGDFIKIEPESNGKVSIYVMQNGTIEYDERDARKTSHKDFYKTINNKKYGRYRGGLTSNVAWRPVYIVDEAGTRLGETDVTAFTNTDIAVGREDEEAYVYDFDHHFAVLCKMYENGVLKNYDSTTKKWSYMAAGSGIDYNTVNGNFYVTDINEDIVLGDDGNPRSVERVTYKECVESSDHYDFFTKKYRSGTNGELVEDSNGDIEVWPADVDKDGTSSGKQGRVWGPKYTGDGWIVISKGYVLYEFDVKAGKSYYIFSNDTKLGFCGYDFVADEKPEKEETLTLEDDRTGAFPNETKTYGSVTLNRNFHEGWNAICLPFSVNERKMREWFGSDGKTEDYELVVYNGDEHMNGHLTACFFHHVYQDIIAGFPYMLYIPDGAKALKEKVTFNNVTIEAGVTPIEIKSSTDYTPKGLGYTEIATREDFTSVGVYKKHLVEKGSYVITAEGLQWYATNDNLELPAFRSYLRPKNSTNPDKLVRLAGTNFTNIVDDMEEEWNATVINDIAEEMGFFSRPSDVYNVSGLLVRKNSTSLVGLPKGIYIVNGKKYFVK